MSQSGIAKSTQAFRTIAEASAELDVPAHVLRFWEGKFTQIKPLKRAGGRRHYRPDDMALLRGIRALLQEDGYQIKGVQKLLKDQGISWVRDRGQIVSLVPDSAEDVSIVPSKPHDHQPSEQVIEPGPLFEADWSQASAQNMNPAAAIVLRKALVKLEKARLMLDHIVKNNITQTSAK